jgi:uncharacterized protein YceK
MRLLLTLLLLVSFTGCSSTVERFAPDHIDPAVRNLTVQDVLKKHFTAEAYEAIKDIPLEENNSIGGALAAGTNFWSKVLGVFIGAGIDRSIQMNGRMVVDAEIQEHIVHEYIHQLHDMQLDGDGDWIDEKEFERRYEQLAHDQVYAGIVHKVERAANHWITNIFGISEHAEYIAYTGAHCATHNCPSYMGAVYRKMLRKFSP